MPAVGSTKVGSRRSSYSDCRKVEMDNQAPASSTATRAVVEAPLLPSTASADDGGPLVPLVIEEEAIEEKLWNRQGDVGYKAQKLDKLANKLEAFCLENRNVYKKIKNWAVKIKATARELLEETESLHEECYTNDKEVKRLRRLVVEHAELFLKALKNSMMQPPAGSRSPAGRKSVVEGSSKTGPNSTG